MSAPTADYRDVAIHDQAREIVDLEARIAELEFENQVLREAVSESVHLLHNQAEQLRRAGTVNRRLREDLRQRRSVGRVAA